MEEGHLMPTVNVPGPPYQITGLDPDTLYEVSVTAVNNAGSSAPATQQVQTLADSGGEERPWEITGTAIYISPTGNDTTGTGTSGAPWQTLAKGFAELRSRGGGHTLVLRGGTYGGDFNSSANTPKGASAGSRARVMGYPGETAIITGQIQLYDPDYTTWDHLVLDPGGVALVGHQWKITNGIDFVFEDIEARNFKSFGFNVTPWSTSTAPQGVFRYWHCHDQQSGTADGINEGNQHWLYFATSSGGSILVERCIFDTMENGTAIKVGPGNAGPVEVRYNTFYNNLRYEWYAEGVCDDMDVHHNIMVHPSGATTGIAHLWNYSGTNSSLRDNVYWGDPTTFPTYGGTTTAGEVTELTSDGGNQRLDPQFVDAAGGDFHTQNASAAGYGRYAP